MSKSKQDFEYIEFKGNFSIDMEKVPSLKKLYDAIAVWNRRETSVKTQMRSFYSLTLTEGKKPTLLKPKPVHLELYLDYVKNLEAQTLDYSPKIPKERMSVVCEISDSRKGLNDRVEEVALKMSDHWYKLVKNMARV
ncbi:hypothetical protein DFH11DRAFT_1546700 [Phellopilus nigrolimitatus]|nr:hypothetical protein DFH11DRAFT_1546700 [Phellopilus nigrolimitatus]